MAVLSALRRRFDLWAGRARRQLEERSRALGKDRPERKPRFRQKNNVEQLSLIGHEITATLSISNIITI